MRLIVSECALLNERSERRKEITAVKPRAQVRPWWIPPFWCGAAIATILDMASLRSSEYSSAHDSSALVSGS